MISFNKYKKYLESIGYSIEKGTNTYYDLKFVSYFFSKPSIKAKRIVNVFLDKDNNPTDKVISINQGYGSIYLGWESIKIDLRKKFWKQFI